jgi:hypothetical protein
MRSVLARLSKPDASHSKQPTNRASQDHALDPKARLDALRIRAHCSVIEARVDSPAKGC